jgi:hypothetical protein
MERKWKLCIERGRKTWKVEENLEEAKEENSRTRRREANIVKTDLK